MSIVKFDAWDPKATIFVRPREVTTDLKFVFADAPYVQTASSAFTKKDQNIFLCVDDEAFEQKLNELEELAATLLHEKSDAWFHKALTRDEIDTMLCSIVRGRPPKIRLNLRPEGVAVFDDSLNPLDEVPHEATATLIFQVRGISVYKDRFQVEMLVHQIRLAATTAASPAELGNEPRFL